MAVTVRLDAKTERTLSAAARRRKCSRSDVVREAIALYGTRPDVDADRRPYGMWLDVIGVVSLGARNPAGTTGERFTALVRTEARARRAR